MTRTQVRSGWCFTTLFAPGYEDQLEELGSYPTVAALRRIVNSNTNCLSNGHFQLLLGSDGTGLVGHVLEAPCSTTGVRAYQLLDACNKTLRIGGSVGASTSLTGVSTSDLRQPERRFAPGDDMLWPGNIPLASHYPTARFTGIKTWILRGPVELYPAVAGHVFRKLKPSDRELTGFVSCHDLFEVYSVCNFEVRAIFRAVVACAYARPVDGWPALAEPWPSNVSQGQAGASAIFGSDDASQLQRDLTPVGKKAFNLSVYRTENPSLFQLSASVSTQAVYDAYVHLQESDQFFVREDLVMISPPPYVGKVSLLPAIGVLDPLPEQDPLPPPPVDPSPEMPVPPSPGNPELPPPTPPPYVYPLPEAPVEETPPMNLPVAVPVNDVPSDIPLPGPFGDKVGANGFCYLNMLLPSVRGAARIRLGRNPRFGDVVAFMQSAGGQWSSAEFVLQQFDAGDGRGSPQWPQAHIYLGRGGLTALEVAAQLGPDTRLGMASAELDSLLTLQKESQATQETSVFDVRPRLPGTRMTFGVYAKLNSDTPSFSWNVLGTPALALMLGIYESVRLESADFNATLSTGVDTSLWIAATENTVTLSGTDQWLAAPINTTICGASTGVVRGKFTLPPDHQFGKEIRAATVGNHGPSFHFNHQGAAGSSSRITGSITVTVSGMAVIGHVNIGPVAKGKSPLQPVSDTVGRFNSTLSYVARPRAPVLDPEDCYLEEEGDFGDDGKVSAGGSSPVANSASKRA